VAVTDPATATVTLVDASTGGLVRTVRTGAGPKGVNWSPDSQELWVVNEGAQPGTVWVYRVSDFARVAEIRVGKAPHNVVLSDDGTRAYVSNTGSATISIIDARTKQPLDTIPLRGAAHNLALTPDGRTLLVSVTDQKQLVAVALPGKQLLAGLPLVAGHHVPATDGAGEIVVGGYAAGAVNIIRLTPTGHVLADDTVPLAPGAHGVAFGPGDVAYVSDTAGFVAAISPGPGHPLLRIPVAGAPFTVSVRVVRKDGKVQGPSSRDAS
jgi:YVTN family beta-propeller protein